MEDKNKNLQLKGQNNTLTIKTILRLSLIKNKKFLDITQSSELKKQLKMPTKEKQDKTQN